MNINAKSVKTKASNERLAKKKIPSQKVLPNNKSKLKAFLIATVVNITLRPVHNQHTKNLRGKGGNQLMGI